MSGILLSCVYDQGTSLVESLVLCLRVGHIVDLLLSTSC